MVQILSLTMSLKDLRNSCNFAIAKSLMLRNLLSKKHNSGTKYFNIQATKR